MVDWRSDILVEVGDQCLDCIANVTQNLTSGHSIGMGCRNQTDWKGSNEDKITCGPFALNLPYYRECQEPNKTDSLSQFENSMRCANDDKCAKKCVSYFLNVGTRSMSCGRKADFHRHCVDYGAIQAGGHLGNGCNQRQFSDISDFIDAMKEVCRVTDPNDLATPSPDKPNVALTHIVVPVVIVTLLICVTVLGFAWWYRRRKQRQLIAEVPVYLDIGLIVSDLSPATYSDEIQELIRKRGIDPGLLELGARVGQGHFGVVRQGKLTDSMKTASIKIAAKILKSTQPSRQDVEAVLNEAVFMMRLAHPNVLHIIGVVWEENSLPVLILPYMGKGDLHTVICKNPLFNEADLFNFGEQILSGCVYLEKISVIHRDIALSNCLVSDLFVVKLADFGLSRADHYYCNVKERDLRWKWLAPECISRGSFSHKSDVWAFGLLLWEMFSNGATPHSAMGSLSVLQECLETGYRMNCPAKMPEYLYELVSKMWSLDMEIRPSFADMEEIFKERMKELKCDVDYDYTPDKRENLFPDFDVYITSNASTYSDHGIFSYGNPGDCDRKLPSTPPVSNPRTSVPTSSSANTEEFTGYLTPKNFKPTKVDPTYENKMASP